MNDTSANTPHRDPTAAALSAEPPPQASDVGTLLCATRMRLGKDLQAVAAVLHIRYNFLVAIEDGRYEDLPGQAYAIGFVRAYADHLGLDGDEVVRRYKDETAGIKRKARYEYPMPTPESGIPSGALLAVAVVLGMVVYGVWYSMADAERRAAAVIQDVPDRLAALLDRAPDPAAPQVEVADAGDNVPSAESDDSDAAPSAEEPVTAPPAEDRPAPAGETSSLPAPAALVAAPAPPSPAATPATVQVAVDTAKPAPPSEAVSPAAPPATPPVTPARPPSAATQPAEKTPPSMGSTGVAATPPAPQVEAAPPAAASPAASPARPSGDAPTLTPTPAASAQRAPAPATVPPPARTAAQVAAAGKDAVELRAKSDSWIQIRDGEQLLLTRFLRKGETYRVPERAGLTLMTLNAGGIDVLVNGEAMPPLGEPGTVARGVALDAQKLKSAAQAGAATPAAPP
jgi:cytoskeletal protein RodZ